MPRPTFADPKTDFAFKRIFGSEELRRTAIDRGEDTSLREALIRIAREVEAGVMALGPLHR